MAWQTLTGLMISAAGYQVLLSTSFKATSGLADFTGLMVMKAEVFQVLLPTSLKATSDLADFTG